MVSTTFAVHFKPSHVYNDYFRLHHLGHSKIMQNLVSTIFVPHQTLIMVRKSEMPGTSV
jgi:hypothetical protein